MAKDAKLNRELAEWLIVALVLFALLVEFILHKVEHWVSRRHPHLQTVLRNLYRELMILGAVSFGFILYIFIAEPTDDIKLTFEVAHIFIFLFAVFHTAVVMATIFISLRLSARWKDLERMELAKYLEKKDAYRKLSDRRLRHSSTWWRYIGWWLPKLSRPFRYWKLHEIMTFHDTRFQFIYYRNLLPDFHFASFLRKIKSATFIELVEIHWTHFVFFLAFVLLDILRGASGANFGEHFEPAFLIAESVFNILVVMLLAAKIRRVYWKMTKNPATYYDAVDRRAVEQERMIAEEEAKIERERSHDVDRPRMSSSEKSRGGPSKAKPAKHSGGGIHTHQPVYANMAYVPSASTSGTVTPRVEGDVAVRHSLDANKVAAADLSKVNNSDRPSARTSVNIPGPYVPDTDSGAVSPNEFAIAAPRSSKDDRRSLEMAMALPTSELAQRTANSKSIVVRTKKEDDYVALDLNNPEDTLEERLDKMEKILSARSQKRAEAIRRLKERSKPTASIAKNARDLERAQQTQPTRNYPGWVVRIFPRLGRVASPAEKLFWFGSHRFFIWCVEWVLFFATVNLSATLAKLGFAVKEMSSTGKAKKAAKVVVNIAVRAAATGAPTKTVDKKSQKENFVLLIISLVVGVIAMLFVLMRIAGIMKKYIFVLNNANMLPESMTIQAIQTIGLKSLLHGEMYGDREDEEELDTDLDEPESVQMRRNLSSFLGTEVHKGHMPGVSSSPVPDPVTLHSPLI